MSFTLQTLATIGGAQIDAPTIYSYKSSDTLGVVTTALYFADKKHEFEEGDLIHAFLATGHSLLEVLSDTSSVGLVDLATGGFEITVDGTSYTLTGRETRVWTLNGATINYPDANTVNFLNIPIRTLAGSGPTILFRLVA